MLTNKEESVLFLHAGGPKTGSSALQNFLEINSENLEAIGISYLNKAGVSFEYQISSGNGTLLFEALSKSYANADYISEVVRSYFRGRAIAICSKEQFGELSSEQWSALADVCKQAGIRLHVIFYVRNVIPFIKSSYDQLIKRHGLDEDFETWVETAEWSHSRSLRSMSGAIAPDAITVIGYDANKTRVVDSFVELIGARNLKTTSNPIVNRSLTRQERDLLRKVNRHTGAAFSTELSDRMIYADPHARSESIEVDEHIENLLEARYKEDIDWINCTFFEGKPIASLGRQGRKQGNRRKPAVPHGCVSNGIGASPMPRTHELVLEWALEKLSGARDFGIQQVAIQQVTGALARIDWHLANDPAIPLGFDPIAYLLNNADLIAADASPFAHFISDGQYETGRSWMWAEGAVSTREKNNFPERDRFLVEQGECFERERAKLNAESLQLKLDVRLEVESILRQQASREQEFFEQLKRTQATIDRERVESMDASEKKLEAMAGKNEKLTERLEARLIALRRELDQSRRETEAQLHQRIEREQLFADQLVRTREEFERERGALVAASDQKLVAVAEQHARSTDEMIKELSSLRIQIVEQHDAQEALLREMVEREQRSNHELTTEIGAMRATSTWRLTAPLRNIASAFKRRYKAKIVSSASD